MKLQGSRALIAALAAAGGDATSKAHGERELREPYRGVAKMFQPPKGNTQRTYGKSFLQRVRDSKSAREAKEVYAQAERSERIAPSTLRKIKKAINARVAAGTWR